MNSSSHSPGPKGYSAYVKDGEYKSYLKHIAKIVEKTTGYDLVNKEEKEMVKLAEILSEKNKGLWANIRAKKKRGEKSNPNSKSYKAAKKAGERLNRKESVVYRSKKLGLEIVEHSEPVIFQEAEYQGTKVELNKVRRGGKGKFYVYAKNPKGNVVKVQFGAKGMAIKTKDPDRRRSFRARMGCDKSPGPKHKANYWSCRMWSGPDAVKNMLKK
jgi:hypothetical protein